MLQHHHHRNPEAEPAGTGSMQRKLLARLRTCSARAREIGKPVVFRLHLRLDMQDPWDLLVRSSLDAEPFFAWNDGRSGLCAAGVGRATELRGVSAGRSFAETRQRCSDLFAHVVEMAWPDDASLPTDVPLAFGGSAFDVERFAARLATVDPGGRSRAASATPMWDGWPQSVFYVPPVLVLRHGPGSRGRGCQAVVSATVGVDDSPERAAVRVGVRIERLLAAARQTPRAADLEQPGALPEQSARSPMAFRLLEDRAAWCARVEAARAAISRSALDKVVLARAADFRAPAGSQFDPLAMLATLRQQHGGAFCFAFGRPGRGCFLGATPEVLVQVAGHRLTTQALAGTARRSADPAVDEQIGRDLVQSVKDQREHAVVSQVLRRVLETLCTSVQSPSRPRLVRLPQVQHLETPFSGWLRKPGGVLDLVERLHPTPSVGGWPAAEAKAWLASHEPLDRGWYAGPIGWLTAAGDGVFAVAIRSVLVRGNVARAYAGAGIVAGSDPQAEWLESQLKLRTVQEALQVRQS